MQIFNFRLDSGEMGELGLQKGALLVVDRAKNAIPNDFVLIRGEGFIPSAHCVCDTSGAVIGYGTRGILDRRLCEKKQE